VCYYIKNAHLIGYGWVLVAIRLERFEHPKGACSFIKRVFSEDCRWMDCYKMFVGQAARHLEFLVGKNQTGPNTDSLKEATAIVQHHDGVALRSSMLQMSMLNDWWLDLLQR
jgi:hypothetical protein